MNCFELTNAIREIRSLLRDYNVNSELMKLEAVLKAKTNLVNFLHENFPEYCWDDSALRLVGEYENIWEGIGFMRDPVALSADGQKIAVMRDACTVLISTVEPPKRQIECKLSNIYRISGDIKFSPDGKKIGIVASSPSPGGRNVFVFDAETGQYLESKTFAFNKNTFVFDREGRAISFSLGKSLPVAGEKVFEQKGLKLMPGYVIETEFSVGDRYLVAKDNGSNIVIWDYETAKYKDHFGDMVVLFDLHPHRQEIMLLEAGCYWVDLYDLETGRLMERLQFPGGLFPVGFDSSGQYIVLKPREGFDQQIWVLNIAKDQLLYFDLPSLPAHDAKIKDVKIGKDTIMIICDDKVRIYKKEWKQKTDEN